MELSKVVFTRSESSEAGALGLSAIGSALSVETDSLFQVRSLSDFLTELHDALITRTALGITGPSTYPICVADHFSAYSVCLEPDVDVSELIKMLNVLGIPFESLY